MISSSSLTDPAQYDRRSMADLAAHGGTTPRPAPPARRRGLCAHRAPTTPRSPRGSRGADEDVPASASPSPARCARRCAMARTRTSAPPSTSPSARPGVATARQVQGKELSYNNLNDTDAAFECVAEFDAPAVVIVKHANPCGVASPRTLAEAWELRAALRPGLAPSAASSRSTARWTRRRRRRSRAIFTEVIIAPDADEAAKAVLAPEEEPAPAADRRPARPGRCRPDLPQRRRRLPGADPRRRPHRRRTTLKDRDEARAHRGGARGPRCSPSGSAST